MKMQHMTRLTDWYVRTNMASPYERRLAAHTSNAAQELASIWGVPLWSLTGPSALNAAYRQRQRNRTKRRR